jgi:hypothetical protein
VVEVGVLCRGHRADASRTWCTITGTTLECIKIDESRHRTTGRPQILCKFAATGQMRAITAGILIDRGGGLDVDEKLRDLCESGT